MKNISHFFPKRCLASLLSLVVCFGFFAITHAQLNLGSDMAQQASNEAGYAQATETSLAETIGTVVKVMMSFLGIIFTVLIFYAGFLWMTAQGDESKVNKAMEIVRTSIVGLVIAISSYSPHLLWIKF
jgi:hypothetical protein